MDPEHFSIPIPKIVEIPIPKVPIPIPKFSEIPIPRNPNPNTPTSIPTHQHPSNHTHTHPTDVWMDVGVFGWMLVCWDGC
jgi:hypothetical protein